MLIQYFVVEAHDLAPRESVQIAAEGVGLGCDLRRRTFPRSLEQRVLNEMGQAVPSEGFVTRTDAQENAEADRTHVRRLLRYDHQPVIKLSALDVEALIYIECFLRF